MCGEVFNYISETKTLVFFENHKYGKYFLEVTKDVEYDQSLYN